MFLWKEQLPLLWWLRGNRWDWWRLLSPSLYFWQVGLWEDLQVRLPQAASLFAPRPSPGNQSDSRLWTMPLSIGSVGSVEGPGSFPAVPVTSSAPSYGSASQKASEFQWVPQFHLGSRTQVSLPSAASPGRDSGRTLFIYLESLFICFSISAGLLFFMHTCAYAHACTYMHMLHTCTCTCSMKHNIWDHMHTFARQIFLKCYNHASAHLNFW